MNKRIEKKHLFWAKRNEIYYQIKNSYEKGYSVSLVGDDLWSSKYGFIPISEKDIRCVLNSLRKEGYEIQYKKFIPKGLGWAGWLIYSK